MKKQFKGGLKKDACASFKWVAADPDANRIIDPQEEKNRFEASEAFKLKAEQNKDKPLKNMEKLKPLNDYSFCPVKDSPQWEGQPMPFQFIVSALQLIEKTEGKGSQTILVEIISNVFRSALVMNPAEIGNLYYFFIVKLAPDYDALETGVGHEISVKAVAKACGKLPKDIRALFKQEGDLGLVVQKGKNLQGTLGGFFKKNEVTNTKNITFERVFYDFRRIAKMNGEGSTTAKEQIMTKLL